MEVSHISKDEFEKLNGHKFGEGEGEIILDGSDKDFGPPKPDDVMFFPEWLELFSEFSWKIVQSDYDGFYRVLFREVDTKPNFTGIKKEYFDVIESGKLIFDNYSEAKCYTNLLKHAMNHDNKTISLL